MKKILCFALLLCLLLCGCGGNVSQVERVRDPSSIYNQREIDLAMDEVERFFRKEFAGCTLEELTYDDGFSAERAKAWGAQYSEDEVIVLLSVFSVDNSGRAAGLNPNETYRNYQWILTRSDGGDWTLRSWGYG